ncbi:MAG: histidine kinase [Bacteroidetes bacterium]|nr:histidine kinase [Bacteroidota bacterium]
MNRLFNIVNLLLVFVFNTRAQQVVLKNFNTKNGLPSNETYFLNQDRKGFIWICTDAGIVKYNGNYFKHFNSANGLPDNTIFEVKEDRFGRMWYRSFTGKVGYIFNDSIVNLDLEGKIEEYIKDGIISSFAFDEQDNLIIGKINSGNISFLKISPPYKAKNVSTIWEKLNTKIGIDVVEVGENDFVFSDTRGQADDYLINIYNFKHELVLEKTYQFKDVTLFTRIYRDKDDIYLLLNHSLLNVNLPKRTINENKFEEVLVTVVSVDSNVLLIGERQKGISFYKKDLIDEPSSRLLNGFTFTSALKDYQNGHWFSTLESGVFYMPSQGTKYTVPISSNGDLISCISNFNDSSILIGYNSGRIFLSTLFKNGSLVNTEIYNDKEKLISKVNTFFIVDPQTVLVSGSNGSLRIDLKSKKTKKIFYLNNGAMPCRKIITYKDSLLCLMIGNLFVSGKSTVETNVNLYGSDDRLTSITYEPKSDQIYVGGLRGLYSFHFQQKITEKDKVLNCRIEDLQAENGLLYIATRTEGVIIKQGNAYDTINEKRGLISNICKSITLQGNTIWISTNNGISKINYFSKNNFQIQNYALVSFMDASSVNKTCFLKGKTFFYSGANMFWFETRIDPNNSKFYISSFFVNDKAMAIKPSIGLSYDQSNIKIGFEALFYDCNNSINYRYKISKNSRLWNYTNETNINLPNLSPGQYELIVEAKNLKGDWIKAETNICFNIEKPFWQKAWFILLEILIGAFALVMIIRYRYLEVFKQERTKNELRINMLELETKALKVQMNPHFIFNSLNSIQQFILANENDNAYLYLSKFSKLVRKLLESTTSESIVLEEEIDILKRYVEIEALRFEDVFSYEFYIDEKLEVQKTRISHMLIQPFIENAIWHGLLHKTGEKKLKVSFFYIDQKTLNCVVEDNGVGRDFKKGKEIVTLEKKSLAIEFITQRLELISKTRSINCGFEIIDNLSAEGIGSGTTVKIIIPMVN